MDFTEQADRIVEVFQDLRRDHCIERLVPEREAPLRFREEDVEGRRLSRPRCRAWTADVRTARMSTATRSNPAASESVRERAPFPHPMPRTRAGA